MKINRWFVIAALLSAQTVYTLAEDGDQDSELRRLRQELLKLDEKVRTLENNQKLQSEAAAAKAETLPSFTLGAGGLNVSTPDSNFTFKVRGYLQADSRLFLGEEIKGNDTFLLRRVRPIFEGTVWKNFEYRIMTDFASGISSSTGNNGFLQDAYLNIHYWDQAQLQFGKFKEPVGLERLQSGANLPFIERGLPTQLVPNRDVGVQLHGQLLGRTISYQVGVFNGIEDGGSGDVETTDDEKDVAARIFAHPFKKTGLEPLQNLGVGIALTHGTHEGALRNYSTAGQQTWFRWRTGAGTAAAPNVAADGTVDRIAPQAYWYWGPFGIFGEYVVSRHELQRTAGGSVDHGTFDNKAWQIAVSYFLTGEDNSFGNVTPRKPFTVKGTGWGAWEITARIGRLEIDDDVFPLYATDASASEAREWAVGLNWHLNKNVKASLNYINTQFSGGGQGLNDVTAGSEEAFFGRVQLSF